jgi:hypothetical protein
VLVFSSCSAGPKRQGPAEYLGEIATVPREAQQANAFQRLSVFERDLLDTSGMIIPMVRSVLLYVRCRAELGAWEAPGAYPES